MNCKNLSYWFKGGILGGLLVFFGFLSYVLLGIFSELHPTYYDCSAIAETIPCSFSEFIINQLSLIAIYTVIGFVVGAIMGLIFGKVKLK